MTVFGVDFHPTFQAGLKISDLRAAGMQFALCKVTEGSGWYRDGYHQFSAAAKAQGLLFCAYHFLRSESSGQAQAAWTKACMGADWGTVPVMLDWETSVSDTDAGPATAAAYVTAVAGLGGRVTLNYCPRWFWSKIGSPNLAAPGLAGMALIQSSYVAGTGSAADLYPGDGSSRWNGFGGKQVSILQFSSKCQVPGYAGPLDINAYRGTRADLASTGWFHDPTPAEDDMDMNTPTPSGAPTYGMTYGDAIKAMLRGANASTAAAAAVARLEAGEATDDQRDAAQHAEVTKHLAEVVELLNAIQGGDPGQLADALAEKLGGKLTPQLLDGLYARLAP